MNTRTFRPPKTIQSVEAIFDEEGHLLVPPDRRGKAVRRSLSYVFCVFPGIRGEIPVARRCIEFLTE